MAQENENLTLEVEVRAVNSKGENATGWYMCYQVPLQTDNVDMHEISMLTNFIMIKTPAVFREIEPLQRLIRRQTPDSDQGDKNKNASDKTPQLEFYPTIVHRKIDSK